MEIWRSITSTTARQFTRKDSSPALFYVHSNHTPPASPETTGKGGFKGQSPLRTKGSAEAIAWTLGTALGLKYVAARA